MVNMHQYDISPCGGMVLARRKGWSHKTRIWKTAEYETRGSNDHQDWIEQKDVPLSFDRWLDWQCVGNWKLISVQRQFENGWTIWCIFGHPMKYHPDATFFPEKFSHLEP